MAAAENDILPRGKVGGIGDVIRDVPKFLAQQNVHVDVIIPSYQFQTTANQSRFELTLNVPFNHDIKQVKLFEIVDKQTKNVKQWVLDHPDFCVGKPGQIYFDDGPDKPFCSDANKFSLFSAAICELVATVWFNQIDVLHLHDWHTAFVPVLREYQPRYHKLHSKKIVYTIHNLAIQGTRPLHGDESSLQLWFPDLDYQTSVINDPRYQHCINPTRAAINLADAVHVVSPTYAKEIMRASDHEHGFVGGEYLENDLSNANAEQRLFGFINGCDYDVQLPQKKKQADLLAKIANTITNLKNNAPSETVHQLGLTCCAAWQQNPSDGPLLVSIGRMTEQKVKLLLISNGDELVIDSVASLLADHNARLIILGSGDPLIEQQLTGAMERNENLLFINGYCDNLSQDLYVNSDLFLMPSSFEPCGISQMLAMRAGQPCLAHKIGGLADTIVDQKTGYLFTGSTYAAQISDFLNTLTMALVDINSDSERWQGIQLAAKQKRFYWQDSIRSYIESLYCLPSDN